MAIPSNRTPVRVARGAAAKFTETIDGVAGAGAKALEDGEIVWDETNEKFQIKVGGSSSTTLKDHTVDTSGFATLTGANFTGDVDIAQGEKLTLGSSYEIYEVDGSSELRVESLAGHMRHKVPASQSVLIEGPTGSIAKFIEGGACELYHDDDKTLETTTSGVSITGDLTTTEDVNVGDTLFIGDTTQISESDAGSGSRTTLISNGTNGDVIVRGAELFIQDKNNTNEAWAKFKADGSVELNHVASNTASTKFETTSSGVKVTGAAVPASITALSYSGSSSDEVDINFNDNNNFSLTTAHAATKFVVPTNAVVAGQSGSIFITQGSTTCAAPTWSTQFIFSTGAAPSFTATEDKVARIDYIVQTGQAASGTEAKIHCVATDDLAATPQ